MDEGWVQDAWLGGKLLLRQPAHGHRAGTDAVLLAAAVIGTTGLLIDVGAGVGSVGLAVAIRAPQLSVALVEADPATAELARQNVALNGFSGRMRVHEADAMLAASRRAAGLCDSLADIVVSNPPFYQAGHVRASPLARQAAAHVLAQGDLPRWIAACLALLRPGGTFAMIHRPAALAEILAACQGRMGDIKVLPLHPRAGVPAHRLLVKGRRGSRARLEIAHGLVLHEADGCFTPHCEALHQGEALVDW